MESLPPLSLEQFAAITARIDAGTPKEEALQEADVPAETWERAQQAWLGLMASQVAQKRYSLHKRYTELVANYRKAAHPKVGGEPRKPSAAEPEPTAALPAVEEPPAPVASPPEPVAPPFEPMPLPPPPVVLPPEPAMLPLMPGGPALSEKEMAALMSVPEDMSGADTLPIPSKAPPIASREPLPFRPALVAPAPAPAPSASSSDWKTQALPAGMGDTLPQDASAAMRAAMKSALPFEPVGASAAAHASTVSPDQFGERIDLSASVQQFRELLKQREHVPGALPPPAGLAPLPFGTTAAIDEDQIRKGLEHPLPFQPDAPRAPASPAAPKRRVGADQKRTIAMSAVPDPGASPSKGATTAPIPVMPGPVPLREQTKTLEMSAVPDPPRAAAPLPQLTLAQYARLCVDLWREPARAGELCARYGIADPSTWTAINRLWQERLSQDPTLMERWKQLMARMQTGP